MPFWKQKAASSPMHHTGSDCYRYVDELIRSSREVMIISPFVDMYYAEFLARNSRGKRIMLLSSSIDRAAQKVLGRSRRPFMFLALAAALAILAASEYYAGILSTADVLASVFLTGVFAFFLLGTKSNVTVRKPFKFVHMKVYISETQAIQGSANLTYNGMHRNIEHVEVINDPDVIDQLRDDFMKLWDNAI